MLLRLPLLLLLLVLLVDRSRAACPPNTFVCRTDGACIPRDWVGDGEPDCEDASDETTNSDPFDQQNAREMAAVARAPGRTTGGSGGAVSSAQRRAVTAEPREENPRSGGGGGGQTDPRPESSSSPALLPVAAAVTTEEIEDERPPAEVLPSSSGCSAEQQQRSDACASELSAWLAILTTSSAANHSSLLLSSTFSAEVLERGCALASDYATCAQGLPATCRSSRLLEAKDQFETYVCQLLLPVVKEHGQACFAAAAAGCRLAPFAPPSSSDSPLCGMLSLVKRDMRCVLSERAECDPSAVELLDSIVDETAHLDELAACSSTPSPSVSSEQAEEGEDEEEEEEATVAAATRSSSTSTGPRQAEKQASNAEHDADEDEEQEQEETGGGGGASTLRLSTIEAVRTSSPSSPSSPPPAVKDAEKPEEAAEGESSVGTTTPSSTPAPTRSSPSSAATVQQPAQEEGRQQQQDDDVFDHDQPPLHALGRLSPAGCAKLATMTEKSTSSLVGRLCARVDDLQRHRDCYAAASQKTSCVAKTVDKKNECSVLESFNAYMDCAIVVINDVCSVDAQNLLIEIQEEVNDDIIEHKCFEATQDQEEQKQRDEGQPKSKTEFSLTPAHPACNEEQENAALGCLVELVEINRQLSRFQSGNFLLEIGKGNSSALDEACAQFAKYEHCLQDQVFALSADGKRCSFASPLNSLARIGLSPLCADWARSSLEQNAQCLRQVAAQPTDAACRAGVGNLGNTVSQMLKGINGEILLCKSFYSIRSAFECGERAVIKVCERQAQQDFANIRQKVSSLGEEEGCPREEPPVLDEILARGPAQPAAPVPTTLPSPSTLPASPLPATVTPQTRAPSSSSLPTGCTPDQQKRFTACVQPLTAFQPHPLAVIRQPKQMNEACAAFRAFQTCRQPIACDPLWARGMSAMFEFACGPALERYTKVRGCIRKLTTRDDVRTCVAHFSHDAPTHACRSANELLGCALPALEETCGREAASFVTDYVEKFATTIDSRCALIAKIPVGRLVALSCSTDEERLVQHCAAPLQDVAGRLDGLFQGNGLQHFLQQINTMVPVFAQVCNLTTEFRQCAGQAINGRSSCLVSSCMVQASQGVCEAPDPAEAIEKHLSCVFEQVNDISFAKCVRTTLATLKQFTLDSFRRMLPRFISCVSEIVDTRCGPVPLSVLRAISSPSLCPINQPQQQPLSQQHRSNGVVGGPRQSTASPSSSHRGPSSSAACTGQFANRYASCTAQFYAQNRFRPVALLQSEDIQETCAQLTKAVECAGAATVCEKPAERALRAAFRLLCANPAAYEKHATCLDGLLQQANVSRCLADWEQQQGAAASGTNSVNANANSTCAHASATATCLAPYVQQTCGEETLTYTFAATENWGRELGCALQAPSVQLATECREEDLIQYLQCETQLDRFSFRPVAILGNGSLWEPFCSVVATQYTPCIAAMTCKFEPVSSAMTRMLADVCGADKTLADGVREHAACLSTWTNSASGRRCIDLFAEVDLVARDAAEQVCGILTRVEECMATGDVLAACGQPAVDHVKRLHAHWAQLFQQDCPLATRTETPTPTTTTTTSATTATTPTTTASTSASTPPVKQTPAVISSRPTLRPLVVASTESSSAGSSFSAATTPLHVEAGSASTCLLSPLLIVLLTALYVSVQRFDP